MGNARWLIVASLFSLPSLAGAQVYFAPPPVPVPPRVYYRHWVRWHRVAPTGVYVVPQAQVYVPPPPPVYAPPVYAPPVYAPPVYAPPVYAPPPPAVVEAPCCAAPAPAPALTVVAAAPGPPQFSSRFGLGVTVEEMSIVSGHDSNGVGFLGQLRYRAARHLAIELMSGYQRSSDHDSRTRVDVPVTFGLLVHILGPEHMLSPYLVGAGGVNFVDLRLLDTPTTHLDDNRTQAIAQLGGGLELRLGGHFALNADVRVEGRWSFNDANDAVKNTSSIDGKPVTIIHDSTGVRVGLGATVYF